VRTTPFAASAGIPLEALDDRGLAVATSLVSYRAARRARSCPRRGGLRTWSTSSVPAASSRDGDSAHVPRSSRGSKGGRSRPPRTRREALPSSAHEARASDQSPTGRRESHPRLGLRPRRMSPSPRHGNAGARGDRRPRARRLRRGRTCGTRLDRPPHRCGLARRGAWDSGTSCRPRQPIREKSLPARRTTVVC
jgi:hypothetical protein